MLCYSMHMLHSPLTHHKRESYPVAFHNILFQQVSSQTTQNINKRKKCNMGDCTQHLEPVSTYG